MKRIIVLFFVSFLYLYASETPTIDKTLIVGTKVAPPFAMKSPDGHWEGISIELWESIAKRLHLKYKLQEHTLDSLLEGVEKRDLDVGIAAITITAQREYKFDFSHSYYTTGLSIVVPKENDKAWMSVLMGIFSPRMFMLMSFLGLILLVIGTVTWLVEKKKNPENFNPNPIKGIASGMWWAAVTMTTVGYGDMTPKTLGGRLIALFWMFASLLLVSSIIAGVASTLTVAKMDHLISKPEDLARGKIASIEHSISDKYLKDRRLRPKYYATVKEGLLAIKRKEVDAMVYDAALLQYTTKTFFSNDLMMTDALFEMQNYGIALPENSPLREKINRVMLDILHTKEWEDIKYKYLGR